MSESSLQWDPNGRLARLFRTIIAARWWVVLIYACLLPPAAFLSMRVGQDNSIDRLIVPTDPDYIATKQFEQVFGGGEFAVLLIEADDPLAQPVVATLDRIERGLASVKGIEVNSALSMFRRGKGGFEPSVEQVDAFRAFARGTTLLKEQGLVLDHFLGVALILDVAAPEQRQAALQQIDAAIAAARQPGDGVIGVHPLGLPYVNAYLDESQRSTPRYFISFVVFVIFLNLALYRSWRTLVAFLVTLGVCLALSVGYIGLTGGTFTLVSPMVPMTILVTATATLVYLHSRYAERLPQFDAPTHHVFALVNKFVACTASVFATGIGFAALAISPIRPVHEMGIWVAVGLLLTWVTIITLFPALQSILKAPMHLADPLRQKADNEGLAAMLPRWSYRWRWPLVGTAIGLSVCGVVAIFGFPGVIAPMRLLTDPIEYLRHDSQLYLDIERFTPVIPGTSISQVWIQGGVGSMAEPDVLVGLHAFQQALEHEPGVGSAVGPTTVLRMMRYLGGEGDAWPTDPDTLEGMAATLEELVPREPTLQRFVQRHGLGQAQITVITRAIDHEAFAALTERITALWQRTTMEHPALSGLKVQSVGLAPLHAKMAQGLVPTLVESFLLTAFLIFGTFLVVFRNGTARLMAMIPSIFAILVMFLIMRLVGMSLNIATILIASTVLGTSENDQIHFFYHFLERRRTAGVEESLRYTLRVAGRAILYATLINAGGFMAFVFADLPAVRQFGVLSALAFTLSMIADFTALPAALWILWREKPDSIA